MLAPVVRDLRTTVPVVFKMNAKPERAKLTSPTQNSFDILGS